MHPNPIYRSTPEDKNLNFARDHGFGALCIAQDDDVLLSHVPFVMAADQTSVLLHLVRSNPMVKLGTNPLRATLAVQGPHGYISPDWYGIEDQVPTWNYVAVHLKGQLVRLDQSDIRHVVDEISAEFENRLADKQPWLSTKMTPATLEKMLIQIVPYRFDIEDVRGTWKLNQNKADEVRLSAAKGVQLNELGSETAQLSTYMRAAKD